MRTEEEMLDIILSFAKENEAVKVVGMEGSRIHPSIKKDDLQDFDVTYVVTDMSQFINNEEWLDVFGKRIFMQKPEAMALYESQLGNWYSYLMLLEDGNRIDLTLVPAEELDLYLSSESLIKVLLDKENWVEDFPMPTNTTYHVQLPTAQNFEDCCNEFWWITTYVAKGICRKEFLYATDYLNQILRQELYRMISWKVGIENDFSISVGKSQRFMQNVVSEKTWNRIMSTYDMSSADKLWKALFEIQALFIDVSTLVAEELDFTYPDYTENMIKYVQSLNKKYA